MKRTLLQSIWRVKARWILLVSAVGSVALLATPPIGFVVNQILAKGVLPDNIHPNVEITRARDGAVQPWEAALHTVGPTDVYTQHLVLIPGGYSGWHTHPGILIGTVASGSIDFYDENCQKRTVDAGQVYLETDKVHAIINRGAVDADLYISYLIKHDAPRRIEADAPACAASTGIR